jgi:hypothetical protein
MPWQKLVDHINDRRVRVESRSGNRYPVVTKYSWQNDAIYRFFMNEKNDDKTRWAWVEFPDDGAPVLEDWRSGDPTGGPPERPPWEHP